MTSVRAQVPGRLIVDVPFDFSAGTSKLKSGSYTVRKINATTLSIRSEDGTKSVLISSALTIDSARSKNGLRLVFNRYGDDYFLSQVWLTEENGKLVFPSKQEIRMAHQSELAKTEPAKIEIAIRTQ